MTKIKKEPELKIRIDILECLAFLGVMLSAIAYFDVRILGDVSGLNFSHYLGVTAIEYSLLLGGFFLGRLSALKQLKKKGN